MRLLKGWQRLCLGLGNDGKEQLIISEEAWLALDHDKRFSRFDVAKSATYSSACTGAAGVIHTFSEALAGDEFLRRIGRILNRPVSQMIDFRMTRYRQGDFIAEHKDAEDGRIARCNLYLDPTWEMQAGGRLMFRSNSTEVIATDPNFNTLVLTRISDGSTHWVEPVTCAMPCRYSLAFSFLPITA